jgi:hypothetical protein
MTQNPEVPEISGILNDLEGPRVDLEQPRVASASRR